MILSGFLWSGWYSGMSGELKTDHSAPRSSLCIHCLWFCYKREKCYGIEMRKAHRLGMRAHFQVGAHRRTALCEKQKTRLYLQVTSTLTQVATLHSEPWRHNSVLVLLNFYTSIWGAFGKGDEMWTMIPFYYLFRKGNGANDALPQALWTWTVTTLISRLLSVPQKKLEEVARSSRASVDIYSCN